MADVRVWGKHTVTLSAPKKVTAKQLAVETACSVIFKSLVLDLKGKGALNSTQVVAFQIPVQYEKSQSVYAYLQDLSFGIVKTAGTRWSITVEFAGTIRTWEGGFGVAVNEPLRIERLLSPQGVESAAQGVIGISAQNGVPDYYATITITACRQTRTDSIIVSVDALDIVAYPIG